MTVLERHHRQGLRYTCDDFEQKLSSLLREGVVIRRLSTCPARENPLGASNLPNIFHTQTHNFCYGVSFNPPSERVKQGHLQNCAPKPRVIKSKMSETPPATDADLTPEQVQKGIKSQQTINAHLRLYGSRQLLDCRSGEGTFLVDSFSGEETQMTSDIDLGNIILLPLSNPPTNQRQHMQQHTIVNQDVSTGEDGIIDGRMTNACKDLGYAINENALSDSTVGMRLISHGEFGLYETPGIRNFFNTRLESGMELVLPGADGDTLLISTPGGQNGLIYWSVLLRIANMGGEVHLCHEAWEDCKAYYDGHRESFSFEFPARNILNDLNKQGLSAWFNRRRSSTNVGCSSSNTFADIVARLPWTPLHRRVPGRQHSMGELPHLPTVRPGSGVSLLPSASAAETGSPPITPPPSLTSSPGSTGALFARRGSSSHVPVLDAAQLDRHRRPSNQLMILQPSSTLRDGETVPTPKDEHPPSPKPQ